MTLVSAVRKNRFNQHRLTNTRAGGKMRLELVMIVVSSFKIQDGEAPRNVAKTELGGDSEHRGVRARDS